MNLIIPRTNGDVNVAGAPYRLKEGVPYVLYANAVAMLQGINFPMEIRPYELPNVWDGQAVSSLLVFTAGGMGDRIQATPALRKASQLAGVPIDVNCVSGEQIRPEWLGLPYIGNCLPSCVSQKLAESYEATLTWEGIIDKPQAHSVPLHTLFAWYMGIRLDPEEEFPEYHILPGEERLLYLPPKKPGMIRVGVVPGTNGPVRQWPPECWLKLMFDLSGHDDIEVVVLGHAGDGPVIKYVDQFLREFRTPGPMSNLLDYTGHTSSVRDLAVAVQTCDVLVASDCGTLHLAGALSIPAVGLYGPFAYALRGTNLPSIVPIQGRTPAIEVDLEGGVTLPPGLCPCFSHAQGPDAQLPCGAPHCAMMTDISIEQVEEILLDRERPWWKENDLCARPSLTIV